MKRVYRVYAILIEDELQVSKKQELNAVHESP